MTAAEQISEIIRRYGGGRVDSERAAEEILANFHVLTPAEDRVIAERRRQVTEEGWTPEHDDQHATGEMAVAAGCYALACGIPEKRRRRFIEHAPAEWPWARRWWKPTTPMRDLEKAAALIIAEMERIERAER